MADGRRPVPPAPRRPDTHSCTAPRGSRSGSRLSPRRLQATRCPAQRHGAGQRAAAVRPPSNSNRGGSSSVRRAAGTARGRRGMAGREPLPALPRPWRSLTDRAERGTTSRLSARVAAPAHAPAPPPRVGGRRRGGVMVGVVVGWWCSKKVKGESGREGAPQRRQPLRKLSAASARLRPAGGAPSAARPAAAPSP